MKQLVSALALAFVGTTAFAQSVAVSCPATPAALGTAGAGWSIASVGPVTRTSTPAAPPAAGYAPAVPAALLDYPPVPPEPGYAWSAGSWISVNATGASNTYPHDFYFKQTIELDASEVPNFSLTYGTQTDDQLWAIYVNGTQVYSGSPLYWGFEPTGTDNYRRTGTHAYTLNSGWVTGTNEVVFVVKDFGGVTGFAADVTAMTLNCAVANPETHTVSNTATATTPSVITNDTVGGAPVVLGTNATLIPGTAPAGMTMDPATGVITVPAGTPPGSYPFPYQLCPLPIGTPPANCVTATATVVVTAAPVAVPVNDWRALGALGLLLAVVSGWHLRSRRR